MNFETEYDSRQSTQISISDHLLLHVFVKPSNLYQCGPSYCKLNEEIVKNNASLIREDLKIFFEIESPISYENFKHNFRDLLKFIQDNKRHVHQKEFKILFRVCPNFVVYGPQRTQLTQSSEFKRIRTFIIRMRIFLINFEIIFQIFFQIVL